MCVYIAEQHAKIETSTLHGCKALSDHSLAYLKHSNADISHTHSQRPKSHEKLEGSIKLSYQKLSFARIFAIQFPNVGAAY